MESFNQMLNTSYPGPAARDFVNAMWFATFGPTGPPGITGLFSNQTTLMQSYTAPGSAVPNWAWWVKSWIDRVTSADVEGDENE